MLRTIHLHGHLKKTFGATFRFEVATAGEALRALHANFPTEFVTALREGYYQIIRGRRRGGMHLELDHLNELRLGSADLHIVPVAKGSASSKGTGTIKAIIGVAIVGAAIFFSGGTLAAPLGMMSSAAFGIGGMTVTYGAIASLGIGIALSGASMLLSKAEVKDDSEKKTDSFTLSGPINVSEQGVPVPIIIGEVIVGSQAISAGADIEDISVYTELPAKSA